MQSETKSCDMCGVTHDASQQSGNFIDYGWSINWLALGHYGGFTDCIPNQELGEVDSIGDYDPSPYMVHMCHDCCVKLIATFPALVKVAGIRGGHPNMNEHDSSNGIATPPCCPYAWTWVKREEKDEYGNRHDTYFATDELGWEKVED